MLMITELTVTAAAKPDTLRAGAESLNKVVDRVETRNVSLRSPFQWLGPHRLTKPNRTIGRASERESQIPEWQEKQKTKTVDKMAFVASSAVTGQQLGDAT